MIHEGVKISNGDHLKTPGIGPDCKSKFNEAQKDNSTRIVRIIFHKRSQDVMAANSMHLMEEKSDKVDEMRRDKMTLRSTEWT